MLSKRFGENLFDEMFDDPVSYTHLDVYKRQVISFLPWILAVLFLFILQVKLPGT